MLNLLDTQLVAELLDVFLGPPLIYCIREQLYQSDDAQDLPGQSQRHRKMAIRVVFDHMVNLIEDQGVKTVPLERLNPPLMRHMEGFGRGN